MEPFAELDDFRGREAAEAAGGEAVDDEGLVAAEVAHDRRAVGERQSQAAVDRAAGGAEEPEAAADAAEREELAEVKMENEACLEYE